MSLSHKIIIDELCGMLGDQNYPSRDLWVRIMKKYGYCLGCKGRCKHMKEICERHQIPLEECLKVNDYTCKCGDTLKGIPKKTGKKRKQKDDETDD
jgi:hypothetical protein